MLPEGKENTSFDDHKFARGKPINGRIGEIHPNLVFHIWWHKGRLRQGSWVIEHDHIQDAGHL